MIDLYDFVEECKAQGLTSQEALTEFSKAQDEAIETFLDNYYALPDVCAGLAQQDVIDMYRRER